MSIFACESPTRQPAKTPVPFVQQVSRLPARCNKHTHTALQCVWSPSHVGFFAFRIRAGDAWFSSTIGWMSVCFVTDQKPLEFYKPHSYWKLFGPLKTKPTQHVHSTLRRRSALDGHLRTGWKRKVSTTQTGKCQGLSKKEKKEKREKKERALFSGVGSIETGVVVTNRSVLSKSLSVFPSTPLTTFVTYVQSTSEEIQGIIFQSIVGYQETENRLTDTDGKQYNTMRFEDQGRGVFRSVQHMPKQLKVVHKCEVRAFYPDSGLHLVSGV